MATIKSYSDLQQSKVLSKILPIESADSHYVRNTHDYMGNPVDGKWSHPKYGNPNSRYANYIVQNFSNYETIPCWSLTALFDALPEGVIENYNAPNLQKENGKYSIAYGNEELLCVADNPLDACYEMIIKLHELKML